MTITDSAVTQVRLEAPGASGKKFYIVSVRPNGSKYTVDFSYGAVGDTPRIGTKTPTPVSLEKASAIAEKLVKEKMNGESHYKIINSNGTAAPEMIAPVKTTAVGDTQPACISPRLLRDIEPAQVLVLTKLDNWWVQIKHDGDRVQLHDVDGALTFYSGRSGKLRAIPKVIADAIAASGLLNAVFDGELVDQTLWVFDLLRTGTGATECDCRTLPYEERYRTLASLVTMIGSPAIKLVVAAKTSDEKARLILDAKEASAEGVVFVNKNAPYRAGRPSSGGDTLRWKFVESGFFIVHEHRPDGKESISVKLHKATEPIGTCSVIGKELPPVGAVVEIKYLYAQSSLVQARLMRMRTDIPVYFCRRSQLKFKDGIDPQKGKK